MAEEKVTTYSKRIGKLGTLYLFDTGSYCTFYLQVEDPTFTKKLTIDYGYPQAVRKNDTVTYPAGGQLVAIRSASVFTSGDVMLRIHPTGTSQLGNGGTLKVSISRGAKLPPPPDLHPPRMNGPTSVRVFWDARGSGDAGGWITQIDIGYGTDPKKPTTILNAVKTGTGTALIWDGNHTVTGLSSDRLYYFFVRSRTKVVKDKKGKVTGGGAGPWSEGRGILTSGGAMVMYKNRWYNAIPYVKVGGVWKEARTYFKQGGTWSKPR